MSSIGDFGPVLEDVDFNNDGSIKVTGKQNVKFYNKKRLSFKAKRDENGQLVIDPRTGIPAKEAFEETVEMVRVETKGDTNIKDDVANDLDRKQHYRHYKFFRDGRIPDGNPTEDFDFLQPSTVMELHYYGVHVIQQVATMSDLVCERLKDQSGFEIRDIAAQWVKINSPQGASFRLDAAEQRIRDLEKQLKAAKSDGLPSDGLPLPLPRGEVEEVDPSKAIGSVEASVKSTRKRIVE